MIKHILFFLSISFLISHRTSATSSVEGITAFFSTTADQFNHMNATAAALEIPTGTHYIGLDEIIIQAMGKVGGNGDLITRVDEHLNNLGSGNIGAGAPGASDATTVLESIKSGVGGGGASLTEDIMSAKNAVEALNPGDPIMAKIQKVVDAVGGAAGDLVENVGAAKGALEAANPNDPLSTKIQKVVDAVGGAAGDLVENVGAAKGALEAANPNDPLSTKIQKVANALGNGALNGQAAASILLTIIGQINTFIGDDGDDTTEKLANLQGKIVTAPPSASSLQDDVENFLAAIRGKLDACNGQAAGLDYDFGVIPDPITLEYLRGLFLSDKVVKPGGA